jgi:hypothetical protein
MEKGTEIVYKNPVLGIQKGVITRVCKKGVIVKNEHGTFSVKYEWILLEKVVGKKTDNG